MTGTPAGRRPGGAATPAISVIVPVYNGEAVLARCLLPLVAFLLDGEIAEVIVVDDGSTDGSTEIAAEHARRRPALQGAPAEALGARARARAGPRRWRSAASR